MKATISGSAANVFGGTGFSARAIAELPAGTEVEILSVKRQDSKRWFSVKLSDGRLGFLPGHTAVKTEESVLRLEDAYAKSAPWVESARVDAGMIMLRGGAWLVGGLLLILVDFSFVSNAINSGSQQIFFPVKLALLAGLVALIYGGIRLLIGVVAYLQSKSE